MSLLFVNFNGKIMDAQSPLVSADNRGLRYGDGLFETIKVINNRIILGDLHFDRLFQGLSRLQFDLPKMFTREYLEQEILALCQKNKIGPTARVRLAVFRGNGGLYDPEDHRPNFVIQVSPSPQDSANLNANGLLIDVYPHVRKSCDYLANLKSNNYLPYVMAALHAKQNKMDDSLLLNQHERICDATIANVFVVKDEQLFTPPLEEGCVAGVMRRYLIEKLRDAVLVSTGNGISEVPLLIDDLVSADEIFLTNAIYGIRWVQRFHKKAYTNQFSQKLFRQFVQTIWH